MRNNDIMDEGYNNPIDDNHVERPWGAMIASIVIAACIASMVIALTIRIDIWILG